jgi:F-type H+-transporting ATPase subunit a
MHIEIAAEEILHIGSFLVTNSLILSWIIVALLVFFAQRLSKKVTLVPGGTQNVVELGVETWLGNMTSIFGSEKKALKYFPFITTLLLIIFISNWVGLLPGIGSFGIVHESADGHSAMVPLLRAPASDLNFTLALALLTIVTINIMGARATGFKASISRYINFSSPMNFFVGFLELIGEFTKIISLSFRLFGNIFAGEVLLVIIGFLAPYIIPIPFLGLEIFAGFIQALVFATLTMVFLSILVEEPHH